MQDLKKLIVRRFIEDIVNTGNAELVPEFIDARYVDHNDPSQRVTGIEGAKGHIRAVRATFPDLKVAIEEQVAEGDLVVTRITARATHQGEWLGMIPTNKPITIHGMNIDRIKNGKIIEHWGAANTLEALLAIGALPLQRKP